MKISDRAKIFASFSPLKGFEEAILEKEKIKVDKIEILEDKIDEIERELQKVEIGCMVNVVHYNGSDYEKTVGCVSAFSPEGKYITIIKRKIKFEDIYDFKIEE